MAYKRQIDRLPIPPKDAKAHNVTCHYCIVGCGYKAYTWPRNKQGTLKDNALGIDLGVQQDADGSCARGAARGASCQTQNTISSPKAGRTTSS